MLNRVIRFSLENRLVVIALALLLMLLGSWQLRQLPVDVFPDLNRPTVTIMTEARGLAPEEVEMLVTRQLEFLVNGATGVQRVRSASGIGLSIVWVEFEWGTDIYRDRQIVAEKLQLARERLPADVNPVMAPISSIMGEIMLIGLRHKEPATTPEQELTQGLELRTLAEFTLRNRLLAIQGVSQVTVMGGVLKQAQILTSPARLAAQGVSLDQLTRAAASANALAGGGVLQQGPRESLIRISGQGLTLEQIAHAPVLWRDPQPVLIQDVADVRWAGPVKRGDGSVLLRQENGQISGGSAVILAIQKQPDVNTLVLDPRVRDALSQIQQELPPGIQIEPEVFRQADFIQSAVNNVMEAVRDGTIWVIVVLFIFLWNFRTSVITLTAIPLSLLMTLLVFAWFGISINTMTLGGLAVAIGELVDDSIVDIENIFRRLRENRLRAQPQPALRVIFQASSEVRNSIVYATLIVIVVVIPLLGLSGLEGRMFAPLGIAYLTTLVCSLVVSLTVTPVLASWLLPQARFMQHDRDALLVRFLKWIDTKLLHWTLHRPRRILAATVLAALFANWCVWNMGSEFLPEFNEGTLTINLQTEPGTSLSESTRVASRAESLLLAVPEVMSVARRTGRAELDEHAEGIHSSEIDVRLKSHTVSKPGWIHAVWRAIPGMHHWGIEQIGRRRAEVISDVRERITELPGVKVNIGQPISHRLDHIMSGIRAQITVKVFGNELRTLRDLAHEVEHVLGEVPGVVDLQMEPQIEIPQLLLRVKREMAAQYGLSPGAIAEMLETAYKGRSVSQLLDEDRWYDLVVWFDEASRSDPSVIQQTIIDTPSGRKVALGQVAEVVQTTGPNTINRENVERRIAVFCNVAGRDLGRVAEEIEAKLQPLRQRLPALPGSWRLELGGQFEAQRQGAWQLLIFGSLAVLVVAILLWKCLGSWAAALQVLLVNLPLAALGSVLMLLALNRPNWETLLAAPWWQWPGIWAGVTTLSLAHWIGFITLIGIVSRNGIMMISHYLHLMEIEGQPFSKATIIRGSLERLSPVMMTAMTTIIGLVPLALGAEETGKEILHPLALVVIGGLLSSTLLDQVVTPAVFWLVGCWLGPDVYRRQAVALDLHTQNWADSASNKPDVIDLGVDVH